MSTNPRTAPPAAIDHLALEVSLSAASLANDYLAALTTSDLEHARSLMADDFSFRGPGLDAALDRETFLSPFGGKYEHVAALRMLRQIEDAAGDVCSLYELDAETRRCGDVPDDGVTHGPQRPPDVGLARIQHRAGRAATRALMSRGCSAAGRRGSSGRLQ